MRLDSPELEKAIRYAALSEMRSNKVLWKDYKRHRKGWLKRKLGGNIKVAALFAFIWMGLVAAARGQGINMGLLVVALYATATTLFRSSSFRTSLLQGFDRVVLLSMPLTDLNFLRYEWKKFAWSWFGAFVLFSGTYSIIVLPEGLIFTRILQVVFVAVLQCLCGASLALWLLVFPKKLKVMPFALPLYALAFASLWLPIWFPGTANSFLWSAILLVPQGWATHALSAFLGASARSELMFLVPVSFVALSGLGAFPLAHKRLFGALESQIFDQYFEAAVEEDESFAAEPAIGESPVEALPLITAENILRSQTWAGRGWIEGIVGHFFNQREKLVAEFLLAGKVGDWSTKWRNAGWVTVAGVVITLFIPLPPWGFFVPAIIAGFMAAPLLGGAWPGFRGAGIYGLAMPIYASMPVSYEEISWVMLKANIVRVLMWAPLLLVYVVALFGRLEGAPQDGALMGAEIIVLVLALQPAAVAGRFSGGTTDTKQFNVRTLLIYCAGLFLLVLLLVAMFGLFFPDPFIWKLLSVAGILGCSLSAWWGYKWLFNRGRVDLLAPPSRSI